MKNIATLTSQNFLRVADKYFSDFILRDDCVRGNERLLYLVLFRTANDGVCRLSQAELSKLCNVSIRSIQVYLHFLNKLEYISIELQPDGHNHYRLLLSDRAKRFIKLTAVDLVHEPRENSSRKHTKNPRVSGAKFAPLYNKKEEKKNINTSPLPVSAPSRDASDSVAKAPGKGLSENLDSDFDKLFAAYPVKQNYLYAKKTYARLLQEGLLPPISQLIDVINLFIETDPVWQGGFAPNLSSWLSGRRWLDQPRSKFRAASSGKCGGSPEPLDEPSPALQQAVKAIQENFANLPRHGFLSSPISGAVKQKVSAEQPRMRSYTDGRDPDVSSEAWKAAHALCGLWKAPVTAPVLTYLEFLASKSGLPDMATLIAAAKEYLSAAINPVSPVQWLRDIHARRSGRPGVSHGPLPGKSLNTPVQTFGRSTEKSLRLKRSLPERRKAKEL